MVLDWPGQYMYINPMFQKAQRANLIVLAGYAAGFIHVVPDYPGFSYLTVLYILNTLMIFVDLLLFLRNRKLEFFSNTGSEQVS